MLKKKKRYANTLSLHKKLWTIKKEEEEEEKEGKEGIYYLNKSNKIILYSL
jgi:hypothetical protein